MKQFVAHLAVLKRITLSDVLIYGSQYLVVFSAYYLVQSYFGDDAWPFLSALAILIIFDVVVAAIYLLWVTKCR